MQKVSVRHTAPDQKTHPDISGARVQSLINSGTVGSHRGMLSIAEFKPGGGHKLHRHRHPNGDEILFIIDGGGKHLTPEESVSLSAGEIAYIPANEYHGFDNPPSIRTKTLFGYFGAGSLSEAGYEVRK